MEEKVAKPAGYILEIDGLRALAVVAVIINHFGKSLLPSGYLGVDVFFVISGFVITASLVNRKEENIGAFLVGYYKRRIKRLAPALFLCFFITIFLISLFCQDPDSYIQTGLLSLVGFSNVDLYINSIDYWGGSARMNPFTHTWSLGVEEQFYFLYPFLVWFCLLQCRPQNGALRLLGVVSLVSLVSLLFFVNLSKSAPSATYYLMPFRFWEIGAGCVLFLLCSRKVVKAIPVPTHFLVLVLVAALFIPLKYSTTATLVVVFVTALVLASIAVGNKCSMLSARPVVFVGVISYSLYLWHWVVIAISRWTVGIHWWSVPIQLLLIYLLATVSYYYVELPLRHNVWFPTRRRAALWFGASSATAVLVVSLFVTPSSNALYLGDAISERPKQVTANHRVECEGGGQTFRTIGNSHAKHILPMLRVFADECNLDLAYPKNNKSLSIPSGTGKNMEKLPEVFETLERDDVLILSSRYHYLYEIPYLNLRGDKWRDRSKEKERKGYGLEVWLSELDEVLAAASLKQVNVVLFLPNVEFFVPVPKDDTVCREEWFRVQSSECNPVVSKELLNQRFSPQFFREVEKRADSNSHFFVYDPLPVYCPGDECARIVDGVNAFSDTNHLSPAGAKLMVADFSVFLAESQLLK